ncbi:MULTISPECIES: hypothetical protein [Bacillaceae]|uniref:hypothetical protein n=1 Tax=Bacillaceae TaxID=186817 RepID=UPI000BFB13BE|nr:MULTISPECIES: hypothetical protein [Bacillaceae]PGT84633.1 hypothetical protein COD11_10445 [Bacillus sp. AFS040349]UGB33683.1 hypothetical protein LPC09_25855 [Metabacillus sp. B2-18]
MLTNLIMIVLIGLVVYFFGYPIMGKPYPFNPFKKRGKSKKNNLGTKRGSEDTQELKVNFQELIGVKGIHGEVVELNEAGESRHFIGLIKTESINYLLRSMNEQQTTDLSYEQLLAQLNLGPGREVNVGIHIQSRPIDLSEQLKPYQESFEQLNPIAQRYGETMFFPYMEYWQQTVDEFDYHSYFTVDLYYDQKLLEDLDEDSIILKVRNEFNRVAQIIVRNYANMGGRSNICSERQLYEALYFSVNKQTGSIEHFNRFIEKDGILSPFVTGKESKPKVRFEEYGEETTEYGAI